jgi:hypothetical protein
MGQAQVRLDIGSSRTGGRTGNVTNCRVRAFVRTEYSPFVLRLSCRQTNGHLVVKTEIAIDTSLQEFMRFDLVSNFGHLQSTRGFVSAPGRGVSGRCPTDRRRSAAINVP